MKRKFLIMSSSLIMLLVSLSSFKAPSFEEQIASSLQNVSAIDATYMGFSQNVYRFTAPLNGELQVFVFQKVANHVESKFDLKSDKLIGSSFKVTYKTEDTSVNGNDTAQKTTIITKLENNY